jgi:hypothetical protein
VIRYFFRRNFPSEQDVTDEKIGVGVKQQIPPLRFATIGFVGFIICRFSTRPESSQEHLPTSIAGVLRLRAIKPSVCDRSAKRFAQDDDVVRGLKYSWLDMQETRKDRKSHRLSGRGQ